MFVKSFNKIGSTGITVIPNRHIHDWDAFIDWALETDDAHAAPQCDFLFGNETIYHIDQMDSVLKDLVGYVPERRHETRKIIKTSDYRSDDIYHKYKDDFELWGAK